MDESPPYQGWPRVARVRLRIFDQRSSTRVASVAGGYLNVLYTLLTFHVAAPVELALAPLHASFPPRGVPPIAAK